MSEVASKGSARSVVQEVRKLLDENVAIESEMALEESVEDAALVIDEGLEAMKLRLSEAKGGADLEKKVRAKRKEKKGGGGHNPFKTKSSLGPGPRAGRNSQTKKFKCACTTPYKCLCRKKGGGTKTIRIKRGYKQNYNHEYKQWRKGQKQ